MKPRTPAVMVEFYGLRIDCEQRKAKVQEELGHEIERRIRDFDVRWKYGGMARIEVESRRKERRIK